MTKSIIPLLAILLIAFFLSSLDVDVGPPSATLNLSEISNIDIVDPPYQYADLIDQFPDASNSNGADLNEIDIEDVVITTADCTTTWSATNPPAVIIMNVNDDYRVKSHCLNDDRNNNQPYYDRRTTKTAIWYPLKYGQDAARHSSRINFI